MRGAERASAPDRRARTLPRYSGGRRAALMRTTDMRDRSSAGPSGSNGCGASATALHGVDKWPVAQCMRFTRFENK
jgi:hypothetical protein